MARADDRRLSPKVYTSGRAQMLRERPRTREEFGPMPGPTENGLRNIIAKLKKPSSTCYNGGGKSRGNVLTIYYLWGDERQAIRRFIDVNEEYVEGCMNDRSNPLANEWDDVLWQLLVEEWEFRQATEADA